MTSFNLPELLSDPERMDQLARTILKNHTVKPLSTLINKLNKEIPTDEDPDNLANIPTGKTLTLEQIQKMTKKDKKEFLAKSEKKNLKVLAQIKEKLKHAMKKDPLENRYLTKQKEILKTVKEYFKVNNISEWNNMSRQLQSDPILTRKLKTIMNEIRSSKVKSFSQRGKKPIINRFIQAKFGSTRDIFSTKKTSNQLTFNFIVDQSGSMGNNTVRVAELIKTFFKAINDIQEIKINVIGYESSSLNIVLNKENDLNRVAYCGGSTPSCEALTYASDLIKKQNGKNVLIFMSDGSPNGIGSYFNTEKYMRYVLEDLKRYKQIDSFGILIGGYGFSNFSKIFGKNFSSFDNLDSANDELTKIFKMFVDEYLRSF